MIQPVGPIVRLRRAVPSALWCLSDCRQPMTVLLLCLWLSAANAQTGGSDDSPTSAGAVEPSEKKAEQQAEQPEFTRDDVLDLVDGLDARKAASDQPPSEL